MVDLGCGTGYFVSLIGQRGNRVVGIDVDVAAVRVAKGFSRDQEFIVAIATKIPIRDRAVNKVLCTEVLEHIVEDSVVMDECQRILDTPGVLVCSSPNAEFVFRSKKVSHETIGPERHVRPGYSPRRLKDLLVGAGFKEICLAFALPLFGTLLVDALERIYIALYGPLRTQTEMQRLNKGNVFWFYRFLFPFFLLVIGIRFPRSFGGSILIASARRP